MLYTVILHHYIILDQIIALYKCVCVYVYVYIYIYIYVEG